jgi:hypothetical protein
MTDQTLETIAKFCPNLESVSFRGCNKFTDEGVRKLAASCRYLEKVDFSLCNSLSDESLCALAKACALKTVILHSAGKEAAAVDADGKDKSIKQGITDKTLEQLAKSNKLTLESVDLSECRYDVCLGLYC